MRIAICVSSPAEREQISRWVSQYCTLYSIQPELVLLTGAQELTGRCDVALMGLGGPDGFLAARQLRERDRDCRIILIDDTREYAIRGVRIHCADFICRPVAFPDLVRALKLAGVGV